MSDSVRPHRWQPTRLLHPWDFPGKSTGVGCHCLLHFCLLVSLIRKKSWILLISRSWVWKRHWQPTLVLLPGKSHGRRSLVGCSPWGRFESDTTERLHFHFSLSCMGEGNGNPLQCSCLENPRDGGTWWAAVWGCTESDTTEAT